MLVIINCFSALPARTLSLFKFGIQILLYQNVILQISKWLNRLPLKYDAKS